VELRHLATDLKLFTLQCQCESLAELTAFDELSISIRLEDLTQTQIGFAFDYVRLRDGTEELGARGQQQVACMRGPNDTRPAKVPASLRAALAAYAVSPSPATPARLPVSE
jgi:enediyne core biosynthesis thioesterase